MVFKLYIIIYLKINETFFFEIDLFTIRSRHNYVIISSKMLRLFSKATEETSRVRHFTKY